ncbi:hypothetical protein PCANC_14791 [Puccinia coronata f. sp. avenae]|uniref:Uncharacterized protein n=1 Tax=Puccinia coronata f. sp. avenae TaxID=200324 RepID=A0A2N5SNW3_9BASI|nr:hypothetical protein PCANC_14791 [Puccinia coronata f. sp. avenae]PLW43061.1 hypothetical protein PCASD_06097 [Puccinia coronata f. sp. avenae]
MMVPASRRHNLGQIMSLFRLFIVKSIRYIELGGARGALQRVKRRLSAAAGRIPDTASGTPWGPKTGTDDRPRLRPRRGWRPPAGESSRITNAGRTRTMNERFTGAPSQQTGIEGHHTMYSIYRPILRRCFIGTIPGRDAGTFIRHVHVEDIKAACYFGLRTSVIS